MFYYYSFKIRHYFGTFFNITTILFELMRQIELEGKMNKENKPQFHSIGKLTVKSICVLFEQVEIVVDFIIFFTSRQFGLLYSDCKTFIRIQFPALEFCN